MEKWKMLVVAVVGVVVLTTGLSAQEQEEAPGVFRTQEELEQAEEEGINSGWVVAYGVLLQRPYLVEFRDDTVWINDVQYEPRKKNPAIKPKEVKPPNEIDQKKEDLRHEIFVKFYDYKKSYGFNKAYRMVVDEFKEDSLISSLELSESGYTMFINYIDEDRKAFPTKAAMIDYDGYVLTEEDRITIRRNEVNFVKSRLKRKEMFIFGYGGAEICLGADDAKEILTVVKQVKEGKTSHEDGKNQLSDIISDKTSPKEIIENIQSWSIK